MKSWIMSYKYRGEYHRLTVHAVSRKLAHQECRDAMFLLSPHLCHASRITKITSSRRAHERFERFMAAGLN